LKLEGIISKRADAPSAPGNLGLWLKVKCLNREKFVVIGWTDPEGARPRLGALLLAYTDPDGRLTYAGRVGAGMDNAELERLWRRLQPLASPEMPLDAPPPRASRFGTPLTLSRVHWVRPELRPPVRSKRKRSVEALDQAAARLSSAGAQFQGSSWAIARAGWSAMRTRTSAR
jgi:ATP-dependent DNA ligase